MTDKQKRDQFIQDHHFLISPWAYSWREIRIGVERLLARRWAEQTKAA